MANLTQTPDIVFVLGGTNDTPAVNTTEASMIKGLQSIYNYIINVIGAKVVALTIPPRNQFPSGAPLTSAHQTKLDNVNNWILSQSGDITPIDIYTILQDGSKYLSQVILIKKAQMQLLMFTPILWELI